SVGVEGAALWCGRELPNVGDRGVLIEGGRHSGGALEPGYVELDGGFESLGLCGRAGGATRAASSGAFAAHAACCCGAGAVVAPAAGHCGECERKEQGSHTNHGGSPKVRVGAGCAARPAIIAELRHSWADKFLVSWDCNRR